MKVRIRQAGSQLWNIEYRKWYFPFWVVYDCEITYDAAMKTADILKNPTIIEIQKS